MPDYFQRVELPQVIRRYERLIRLEVKATRAGRPDIAAQVGLVIVELRTEMSALATRTAEVADRAAVGYLAARRKRPETSKGVHLNELVKSRPTRPTLGGVGFFSIDELNKAVNPNGGSSTPYWRAIEYGLDEGFVGRKLRGFYQPGSSRPSPERRGEHPIFESAAYLDDSPFMTISRPIRAQNFLSDGVRDAYSQYSRDLRDIDSRMAARINAIGTARRRRRR